jgi:hypothetical protein
MFVISWVMFDVIAYTNVQILIIMSGNIFSLKHRVRVTGACIEKAKISLGLNS